MKRESTVATTKDNVLSPGTRIWVGVQKIGFREIVEDTWMRPGETRQEKLAQSVLQESAFFRAFEATDRGDLMFRATSISVKTPLQDEHDIWIMTEAKNRGFVCFFSEADFDAVIESLHANKASIFMGFEVERLSKSGTSCRVVPMIGTSWFLRWQFGFGLERRPSLSSLSLIRPIHTDPDFGDLKLEHNGFRFWQKDGVFVQRRLHDGSWFDYERYMW